MQLKFIFCTATLAAALATNLSNAQTTREEMYADLNKTGGVYYAYPVTQSENTAPPKGYEPFYISHYGRHGSRYLISDKDYTDVAKVLHAAKKAGALTPLGEDAMLRIDSIIKETDKRAGDLTPLGVKQHRGIAERMYAAYPQVFKGNPDISARSTLVVRCVLSMDAFCERLKELNPKLNITRESSQRYMGYLCHHTKEANKWKDTPENFGIAYNNFEKKHINPDRLLNSLFNNREFIDTKIDKNNFIWNLYYIASGMQDIETEIDLYDLFTPEELFNIWQCFNYRFYVGDGNYPGSDRLIINNAKPLVENIITSAQQAIDSGENTATLRFGHDGNLIPLVALMGIEGCDAQEADPEKFHEAFAEYKIAPMAGNLQLVFFRDPKHPEKPVLVKFMLNEREKAIPISTDTFPFYPWDAVKAHYTDLLAH